MKYKQVYYTIGQVSNISELPQSVLRYWETVIDALNPVKSAGGTRQYSESDIELVLKIKKLLYDDGFTIKGANKHISDSTSPLAEQPSTQQFKAEINAERSSTVKTDDTSKQHSILPVLDKVITELRTIVKSLDN